MEEKEIFLLIDGSAIIHRAYHAMPFFTKADGTPTGAVYGFFAMTLRLLAEIKPTYIAVAFDKSKPTVRMEMFAGYHAARPQASDDLKSQFVMVREALAKVSIPVYEVDGFEGDDVIGRINKEVNEKLPHVINYIVTGDRDMLQLVDNDTKVMMPVKGISEVLLFDRARVEEKYGVKPEQIIDYKALIGDPSDGYPGVAGVGPKTAANLLKEYGTFENIYEHIREIEKKNPSLALKLANGVDSATLAKRLAAIITDTPFSFDIKDCEFKNLSEKQFEDMFREYEFNSLIKRIKDVYGELQKKSQMKLL